MKLTVIGATGGIGRAVVAQALEAGHDITAVVRDPRRVEADVHVVPTDLSRPDPAVLASAMEGAAAVLSAIGPRRRGEWGIVSRGTAAIAEAMAAAGARRVLIVTGVGISTVRTPGRPNPAKREPGAGFVMRRFATPLARAVIGEHMADVATAEEILAGSGLDWTSVRVPYLVDAPLTGVYKVAYGVSLPRAFRLGRADAAHFMLGAVDEPRAFARPVTVAY
ncbi:NAD(P)-dependent oxidoreductase [Glycomyces salinus]|uniref:NAD(P)-dependent oxidoreductase n=1 Tax=Glycomyces salinus TaxID=980294 RepID=UPI0018EBCBA9|nr:NAD(P)H-binding protein [Glycomyces salinus]